MLVEIAHSLILRCEIRRQPADLPDRTDRQNDNSVTALLDLGLIRIPLLTLVFLRCEMKRQAGRWTSGLDHDRDRREGRRSMGARL